MPKITSGSSSPHYQVQQAQQQIEQMRKARGRLTTALDVGFSHDSDARSRPKYDEQTRWLKKCVTRLAELADGWERGIKAAGDSSDALKELIVSSSLDIW
jgi:predicted P-loop ATPase